MTDEEKRHAIVARLASAMFYGKWVAETPNERVIEMLMNELGLYPISDEDTLLERIEFDEELTRKAEAYFANKNQKK